MENTVYVLEDRIKIPEEYMKMTEQQLLDEIAKQLARDGKTAKMK